jgi:long-chain acyl-CoA synthetase
VLEDRIRAHRLVSQCIVVGDQRPFIAALITLDEEALPLWLESKGKSKDLTPEQLREDDDVLAEVQSAVDDANRAVSKAEAIKKFRILGSDFTETNGLLTPSLKLKRSAVLKEFDADVEALYTR